MAVIALIGDLIGSKRVSSRAALQKRLARALQELSATSGTLASPYTLTLGDEFQAVYQRAETILPDLFTLMAHLHPVRARFALGVGRLSTAINPQQALGMDGPAFHQARTAMELMKQTGATLRVEAKPAGDWAATNHVLAYLGHHLGTWSRNRFDILRLRLLEVPVAEMADELRISRVAIHKNIRVAALDDVAAICHDITASLARGLADA